ncbi:MAG: hypothetical protein LBC61_07865 [Candidatus Peribacteria bacterium]|nr:hypothetical protein [Candidatus Peribacteria bacterium]
MEAKNWDNNVSMHELIREFRRKQKNFKKHFELSWNLIDFVFYFVGMKVIFEFYSGLRFICYFHCFHFLLEMSNATEFFQQRRSKGSDLHWNCLLFTNAPLVHWLLSL